MLFEHRKAKKNGNGRTCFWRLRKRMRWMATLVRLLSTLFPGMPAVPFSWFLSSWDEGLLFLSLIVSCLLCFHEDDQQTMVMLVVNNLWFSGVLFSLAGTKTMAGLIRDSPLPFSPSLCIYFFWVYALFLFCGLLCFWVVFFGLCFVFGLIFLVLTLFLGWFLFFLGSSPSWFCQLLGIYRDQSSSPSASRLSSW